MIWLHAGCCAGRCRWITMMFGVLVMVAAMAVTDAAAQGKAGCVDCHAKLSQVLPSTHPPDAGNSLKECVGCHSTGGAVDSLEWKLHYGHYRAAQFSGNCWSCHAMNQGGGFELIGAEGVREVRVTRDIVEKMASYFKSWATSDHSDQQHAQKKVTCRGCHGAPFPKERVGTSHCLTCHKSYPDVATLTAKVEPNPHSSHLGEIRCTLCHRAHARSVYYCNQCHAFDVKLR